MDTNEVIVSGKRPGGKRRAFKVQKRVEAEARQAKFNSLTIQQKLERAQRHGAKKEIAKWSNQLADVPPSKKK